MLNVNVLCGACGQACRYSCLKKLRQTSFIAIKIFPFSEKSLYLHLLRAYCPYGTCYLKKRNAFLDDENLGNFHEKRDEGRVVLTLRRGVQKLYLSLGFPRTFIIDMAFFSSTLCVCMPGTCCGLCAWLWIIGIMLCLICV